MTAQLQAIMKGCVVNTVYNITFEGECISILIGICNIQYHNIILRYIMYHHEFVNTLILYLCC